MSLVLSYLVYYKNHVFVTIMMKSCYLGNLFLLLHGSVLSHPFLLFENQWAKGFFNRMLLIHQYSRAWRPLQDMYIVDVGGLEFELPSDNISSYGS